MATTTTAPQKAAADAAPSTAQRAPAVRREPAVRAPIPHDEVRVILVLALVVLIGGCASAAWFAARRTRGHEAELCRMSLTNADVAHRTEMRKLGAAHQDALGHAATQCTDRVAAAEAALRERILGAIGDPR